MSEHSLQRTLFLSTLAFLMAAPAVFAANPSARFRSPLEYSGSTHRAVLFGGSTAVDSGTKISYELRDTWEWSGGRWIQRFPAHAPAARSGHDLVYDSIRERLVLFGGHTGKTDLNDTWQYKDNDWSSINVPASPSVRQLAGAAFDPIRDRILLFGGTQLAADAKTNVSLHDTWEFDGTTWKQILADGPAVSKPLLAYDAKRNQVVMLAINDKFETQMYIYDPAATAWKQQTPAALPPCVNEGMLTYHGADEALFYTGGVCTASTFAEDSYEWDGTTWNKIEVTTHAGRVFGAGLTYVPEVGSALLYGGAGTSGVPRSNTFLYNDKTWLEVTDTHDPAARSLPSFTADPVNKAIWMLGGVNDTGVLFDFWKYQNGTWYSIPTDGGPTACSYPNAAYDRDREKLVVLCDTSTIYEWDGAAWKKFDSLKEAPPARRFSSMVYDANLKKTVLFGGFNTNYLDETWTWDGAAWSRQKRNPAPSRALTAMWYDPTLKRTVLYGGLGRLTSQDVLNRFSDMWSFDGNGWTEIKPSAGTPGARYGAQVAVDPRTSKVELFGGLRLDVNGLISTQVYADDTWEFDGSKWTRVATDGMPEARENGRMDFDYSRNEMVLFGGYAGSYFSDVWTLNQGVWRLRNEVFQRRRGVAK